MQGSCQDSTRLHGQALHSVCTHRPSLQAGWTDLRAWAAHCLRSPSAVRRHCPSCNQTTVGDLEAERPASEQDYSQCAPGCRCGAAVCLLCSVLGSALDSNVQQPAAQRFSLSWPWQRHLQAACLCGQHVSTKSRVERMLGHPLHRVCITGGRHKRHVRGRRTWSWDVCWPAEQRLDEALAQAGLHCHWLIAAQWVQAHELSMAHTCLHSHPSCTTGPCSFWRISSKAALACQNRAEPDSRVRRAISSLIDIAAFWPAGFSAIVSRPVQVSVAMVPGVSETARVSEVTLSLTQWQAAIHVLPESASAWLLRFDACQHWVP